MVLLGKKAPGFSLKGVLQGKVSDYSLESYKGKWLVLFFYPADFTFICPTEVTGFSKFAREFRAEQAEILGPEEAHVLLLRPERGHEQAHTEQGEDGTFHSASPWLLRRLRLLFL